MRGSRPTTGEPNDAGKKDEQTVNAARRAGGFSTANAGTNRAASSGTSLNTRTAFIVTSLNTNSHVTGLSIAIRQARLSRDLTQAELARMINETLQAIQAYESGRTTPNSKAIGKLESALGVTLR